MSGRAPWVFASLLALVLIVALGLGLQGNASVVDEHPHVLSGYLYWETGSFAGGFDNPPLGQLWLTLPFALSGFDYHFPDDTHLLWPRLMTVLLTLVLGAVLALWAGRLWGVTGVVFALLLFTLDPNILAHGHLATLDLALTCAWWLSLYCARLWLSGHRWALAATCVVVAIASLTKFTGLFLFPALGLVVLWGRRKAAWPALLVFLVASVGSLWVIAWCVYGFQDARLGWPAAFVEALEGKWAHREDGHFSYLMGRRSQHGFFEYNLIALLVKTSLPLWGLAVIGVLAHWRRTARLDRWLLVVPAFMVLLAFSVSGVNIGMRHLLPLVPAFLLWGVGGLQVLWCQGRPRRVLAILLVLWVAVSVGRLTPNWLAYFNEAAGGPGRGDRWLIDSNLDWGQDDARMTRFFEERASGAPALVVLPDALQPRTGHLAVNVNALHGILRVSDEPYAWLRRHEPSERVGWCWRVWDLKLEDYRQTAEAHPQDSDAWVDYAQVLATEGSPEGGLNLLEARRERLDNRGWQVAVELALEAQAWDRADAWLQSVPAGWRQDPRWPPLLMRRDIEPRAVAGEAAAQVELGVYWATVGRPQRAEPLLRRAAERQPDDVDAQSAWVVFLGQQGRYREAVDALHQSSSRTAMRAQAVVLERAATTREALQSPAASSVSPDIDALRELATAEFAAERFDVAAAALVQLLRQQPADRDALHLLGEMQVRHKLGVVPGRIMPRSLRSSATQSLLPPR